LNKLEYKEIASMFNDYLAST